MPTTYLGRVPLGETLVFTLTTKNSSGVPTQPHISGDSWPLWRAYSGSALVESGGMYKTNYPQVTGQYSGRIFLDSSYSAGHYTIHATYTTGSGSFRGNESWEFQIVGGGNASGPVVALAEFDRIGEVQVIGQYADGTLWSGRNPY